MAHPQTHATTSIVDRSGTGTLSAVAVAALLGVAIIFLVGFAQPSLLHNAAHDTRHGLVFPCH